MTQRRSRTEDSRRKQQEESLQTESVQILTLPETCRFRNSLKQNICVELLLDGYHRSFSEFFSLLDPDRVWTGAPEPDVRTPLDGQRDKLETMLLHLRQAEQAENTCSWTAACDQRLLLGRYFSGPEDLWLSLHFYHRCADAERGGHSRPATEALARLAEIYLQLGELQQARRQAERCVRQADEGGWPLRLEARRTLWSIYSRLAEEAPPAEAQQLLHEGRRVAAESEDKRNESEACYRLGLTYQRAGDHDKAKKFLNSCIQIGDGLDADWLGKSYKALAVSVKRVTHMTHSSSWRRWSSSLEATSRNTTWQTASCVWATPTSRRASTARRVNTSCRPARSSHWLETCLCCRSLRCRWRCLAHFSPSRKHADVVMSSPAALRRQKEGGQGHGPGTQTSL
ncbi:tetratricopeptide repeat protein 29 isoform X2 [Pungitius pungitius]|uniref:tetratricopeptide repeat protein 29 isoform X2 n=1 Tax=Pungitius pungitius TaxID=134920 RepID=UPI002E0DF772